MTAGRQLWIADALRAFDLAVIEVPDWQTRGSIDLNPTAVLVHHTAAVRGRNMPSLGACAYDGNSTTTAPLCQVLIGRDGLCAVIAAGRAHHAGDGGPLFGVGPGGRVGNRLMLGIEAENDGLGEPWPAVQLDAFHRATAALLDGIGRTSERCWAHREWTTRKIDPAGINMTDFRAQVSRILTDHQETAMPTTPTEWSLMHLEAVVVTVGELYDAYRGVLHAREEVDAWGRDLAAKLANGEDPNPTLRFIQHALAKEPRP